MPTNRKYIEHTISTISEPGFLVGSSSLLDSSMRKVCGYSYAQQFNGSFADLSVAQKKVSEFGQMQQNWDGYGAEPIGQLTSGNTSHALTILSYQLPMPDITPNPNGTLSLEWETGAGSAHLEIGRTQCSLYVNSSANVAPLFFAGDATDINGQVGALVYSSLYAPLDQTKPVSLVSEAGHDR